jgi:hypothetical protein
MDNDRLITVLRQPDPLSMALVCAFMFIGGVMVAGFLT